MVTHEDLTSFYGEEHVCCCSCGILEALQLPKETRYFLTDVGLPEKDDGLFAPHTGENGCVVVVFHPPRREGETWLSIGGYYGSEICIHPANGSVWVLPLAEDYPGSFVNSWVGAFVEFHYLLDQLWRQDTEGNEEGMRLAAAEMEDAWRRLDPKAIADSKSYWSIILEDTKFQFGMIS